MRIVSEMNAVGFEHWRSSLHTRAWCAYIISRYTITKTALTINLLLGESLAVGNLGDWNVGVSLNLGQDWG
jgi:hypothetical protein